MVQCIKAKAYRNGTLFTQKTIKPLSAGKSEENEDPKQITQKKELYD